MAEHSGYTVRQLLPDKLNHVRDAIREGREKGAAPKSKKLPGAALAVAERGLEGKVLDALKGVDLFELIARAWAKAPELRKAGDEAAASVNKTSELHLGEHELSAGLAPIAELSFATFGTMTLQLRLALSIGLTSADVTICDRRIVKIGKTEGQVTATLSCGALSLGHPLKSKILFHDELVLKEPALLSESG